MLATLLQLREAESVAAERDQLAARLTVLEARMDETRVERSQVGEGGSAS